MVVSEEDDSVYVVMRHEDFARMSESSRQGPLRFGNDAISTHDGEYLQEANERLSLNGGHADDEKSFFEQQWAQFQKEPQLKDLPL